MYHVFVHALIDYNTKLVRQFIQDFNHGDISIDVCPGFKIIQSRQAGPKVSTPLSPPADRKKSIG
jgi:hypothetical protein